MNLLCISVFLQKRLKWTKCVSTLGCGLSDICSLMAQNNPALFNINDSFRRCMRKTSEMTKTQWTQWLKKKNTTNDAPSKSFKRAASLVVCESYSAIKKLAPYQMKVCPSTWCSTPTQAIVKAAILSLAKFPRYCSPPLSTSYSPRTLLW